jgi:hypothetical protein
MRRHAVRRLLYVGLFLLVALPSLSHAEGLSFRGFGPRAGLSADPDQVFAGMQWDLGNFGASLRFQPNFEVGFGDDQWLFTVNAPALWFYEKVDWGGWTPYTGGEIGINYARQDRKKNTTDLALNAVGGFETRLKSKTRLFIELKLGLIENPDFKILVGWNF